MAKNKKSGLVFARRGGLLFFVLVLVLSTLASFVFNPTPASAAIRYSEITDWDQRLLLWEYGRTIAGCYLADEGVAGKDSEIRAGQIFYEDAWSGYYPRTFSPLTSVSGEDTSKPGIADCGANQGAIAKKAFQAWDIDPLEFVCSMGYQRSNENSDCLKGDGDFKAWGGIEGVENRTNKFKSTLKQYTGIDVDNPGDEILYLFARATVVDLCTTGEPGADGASGTMRYSVNEVVDGKSVVSIYTGGMQTSDKILKNTSATISTPFGWTKDTTCLDVMNNATEKFTAYWNTLREDAVEEVCRDQGYINISASSSNPFGDYRLAACISGFNNADDPLYCSTTYAPKDMVYFGETITNPQENELEACKFGRQIDPETLAASINNSAATNTGQEQGADDDESPPTCVVDSIGWIVCPLMGALGGMADAIYAWIESILLTTPLQQTDGSGDETVVYKTWQNIRDIANVLLVIAFFIVIISQVTSMGVSNYGVKKTLPRIIIVAIAINLSFFLMQLAIDVTNLIGTGIYEILTTDIVGGGGTIASDGASTAVGWTAIITTLLAGGIAVAFISVAGLGAVALMILPVLLGVVLSLFAAILTLLMRDAFIIILVILAPVAFVAYLLPNTQNLFNQWRKGLTTILFLYPTAAILFGGSKAASEIISTNGGDLNTVVALVVMAAPLGMLPWLAARGNGIMAQAGGALQGLAKRGRDAAGKPFNNYLKEKIGQNLSRRQAGTHNMFGRELSDRAKKKKAVRAARGYAGGRNVAEVFAQNKQRRQDEIETNKKQTQSNYNRRTERAANYGGNWEGKSNRGTQRSVAISNRAHDINMQNEATNAMQEKRMKQRVQSGEGSTVGMGQSLLAVKTNTEADKQRAVVAEVHIDNAVNSAATVQAGQVQEDVAKKTTEQLESERVARAKEEIKTNDDAMAAVYKTAEATLAGEQHQAEIDNKVEYAKTHSGALVPEAARGLQKQNATTQGKKDVLEAQQTETQAAMDKLRAGEDFAGQNFYGTEGRVDMRRAAADKHEAEISSDNSKAKLAQRLQGNVEASDELIGLKTETEAIKSETKASETRVANQINQDARLRDALVEVGTAEATEKRVSAENEALVEEQMASNPDAVDEAIATEDANLRKTTATSQITAAVERQKQEGGTLRGTNLESAAAEITLEDTKAANAQDIAEIKAGKEVTGAGAVAAGTIKTTNETLQARQMATNIANTVASENFTDQLNPEDGAFNTGLLTVAGGDVDPSRGQRVATARGAEEATKAYEANVGAYTSELKRQGLPSVARDASNTPQPPSPGDNSLLGIAVDRSRTLEERDAAGRAAVASGDIDTAKFYFDHLATELAAARAAGDTDRARDIVSLQKSYAAEVAKSPGKPMGLGAAEIQQMASTGYTPPTETKDFTTGATVTVPSTISNPSAIQTFATVVSKGVSANGFASMDKNDIMEISGMIGELPAGVRASLKAEVNKTLTDTQVGGNVKGRERELLEGLMASL